MNKTIRILCPHCGKKHPVNPGTLLNLIAYEDSTQEQRQARVAKANAARRKNCG